MTATTIPAPTYLLDTRPARGKHRTRRTLTDRLQAAYAGAVGHLRASARAAYGTAVLCSALLAGLATIAAGVRL